MKKYLVYVLIVIVFGILICVYLTKSHSKKEICKTWDGDIIIGHAFSEIDKNTYTNSLEAFYEAYNNGLRTMEVDFQLTSDNKVVLSHDFNGIVPSEKEFLDKKINEKYTPLSFEDLIMLMKEYPDVYIVTDTKYIDKKHIKLEFNEMLKIINKLNAQDVLDRFIIQVYNEKMYGYVENVYPFKNVIFTLYMRWDGDLKEFENICKWSEVNNIRDITMWYYLYDEKVYQIAQKYKINIYVHTVNNLEEANNFIKRGVVGIYTDSITPNDIKNERYKNEK